jgi:Na+/H+ antiporter NhaA
MVSLLHYNESAQINCEYKLTSYQQFSPQISSFIVVVYTVSAFFAFSGNIIVIVVELFGKLTNANFRKFLINLAIVDILTAVFCVPLSYSAYLNSRWVLPHFLCPVVHFVSLLSVFVNTITLTVISIDR